MWKAPSVLVLIVLALLILGVVMLASTSGVRAETLYQDQLFFVKRQFLWLFLGLLAAFFGWRLDYHFWRPLAVPLLAGSVLLLLALFVPGVGSRVGGSTRWLRFGAVSVQPSEIAKFAIVVFLSWWMARERRRAGTFKAGFLAPMGITGLVILLILAEPDFGTTVLCGVVAMAVLFAGGARWFYLAGTALLGGSGMAALIYHDPVRATRILAFLDPEKYAETCGYQLIGALNAFITGGLFGRGLSKGVQKHFYLPESHTDFIFAVVGEELGLFWSLAVLLLFLGFFLCGMTISWRARDLFGRLLAFGLTLLITLQATINIAVVTGCMPTKGLPLPFMSYGGSSVVVALLAVGVLINIACHSDGTFEDGDTGGARDRVHRVG
jgi:cell division protein FtsW